MDRLTVYLALYLSWINFKWAIVEKAINLIK